jgi:hypothetical protein
MNGFTVVTTADIAANELRRPLPSKDAPVTHVRPPKGEAEIRAAYMPMSPYVSQSGMETFEFLLEQYARSTMGCWRATRLHNASASLACDGNVSTKLLHLFDAIRKVIDD